MSRHPLASIPLILLALALPSCDDEDGAAAEFAEARSRWAVRGPASYDLVLERLCFCGPEGRGPVRIEVRDREVVSRAYVETGEPVREELEPFFPDVDGLFDLLADAFRSDPHSIEIEYDPVLGFPTRSFVDFEENVADEEQGHRVIELEIVRP